MPSHSLRISVVSIGEIMRGVATKEKNDPRTAERVREWLAGLRRDFHERIEIVDDEIAIEWGRLSALRSRGEADCLLAATAIVRDLTLVTRNVADFVDLPLTLINPWDDPDGR